MSKVECSVSVHCTLTLQNSPQHRWTTIFNFKPAMVFKRHPVCHIQRCLISWIYHSVFLDSVLTTLMLYSARSPILLGTPRLGISTTSFGKVAYSTALRHNCGSRRTFSILVPWVFLQRSRVYFYSGRGSGRTPNKKEFSSLGGMNCPPSWYIIIILAGSIFSGLQSTGVWIELNSKKLPIHSPNKYPASLMHYLLSWL